MNLLLAPQTLPFGVAFGVLLGLTLIEGIGLLLASSPSHILEGWLTDSDSDADGALGWLLVGKVPVMVLLILFLLGFSLSGYAVQMLVRAMSGIYFPVWIAAVPALVLGITTVRALGGLFARLIPKDETVAVSETSFIGRSAEIVSGTARCGMAAQARLRDAHGHTHYIMLEPDVDGETFAQGSAVLIVRRQGGAYRGISDPHADLATSTKGNMS